MLSCLVKVLGGTASPAVTSCHLLCILFPWLRHGSIGHVCNRKVPYYVSIPQGKLCSLYAVFIYRCVYVHMYANAHAHHSICIEVREQFTRVSLLHHPGLLLAQPYRPPTAVMSETRIFQRTGSAPDQKPAEIGDVAGGQTRRLISNALCLFPSIK